MATKPLTQQEFARLGAQATNAKYSKEKRSEWAKRGPIALKEKYGQDYFKKLGEKMGKRNLVKRQQKQENEAKLGY